jgi:ketosteroid isomerase-like protein
MKINARKRLHLKNAWSRNIRTVLNSLDAEAKGDVKRTLKLLHPAYSMTWVEKDSRGKLFPHTSHDIKKELEEVYPIQGRQYEIQHIAEGKNTVIIEMVESYPDSKTKKVYRTPLVIVLEMSGGKIKKGRHYCDPRLPYLYLKKNQIERLFRE